MEEKTIIGSGVDLEQFVSHVDRAVTLLASTEARLTTSQITPGETIFRDPQDAYHQITIGAVLCCYGLSAHHARLLDGLLSMTLAQFREFLDTASQSIGDDDDDDDEEPIGSVLLRFLKLVPGPLEQYGRYAEWRRAYDRYMERATPFLDTMSAEDLKRLASRPPSKKQMHLIRVTCAYHRIAFPTVTDRRAAYEWLRDVGANLKFREMQP